MTTTQRPEPHPFFAARQKIEGRLVVIAAAIGSVVVIAGSAVAWDGGITGWEKSILKWINGWPDFLEPIMWAIQQPGALLVPVVAGAIIAFFTRRWQHFLAFVLILPLKLGIEKAVVKQLVDRQRPFTSVGPEINVRGPAFDGLSFPSGHSTTAFAMFVLATAFLPGRWRWVAIGWAFAVGIARLYYGEHNVLDVVVGATLGTVFAMGLRLVLVNPTVQTVSEQIAAPSSTR